MTKSKVNYVLWIYAELLKKNYLRKEETMALLHISIMSFRRYIKDIRLFLKEYGQGDTLLYRRREDVYWLHKGEAKTKEGIAR